MHPQGQHTFPSWIYQWLVFEMSLASRGQGGRCVAEVSPGKHYRLVIAMSPGGLAYAIGSLLPWASSSVVSNVVTCLKSGYPIHCTVRQPGSATEFRRLRCHRWGESKRQCRSWELALAVQEAADAPVSLLGTTFHIFKHIKCNFSAQYTL